MSNQEGEAAQTEDQEDGGQDPSQDPEDQGQDLDQGQEDQGQGSAQDDEEQRGIEDEVQPDDGQDAADEMLVGTSSQVWLKIRRHKKMALGPESNYFQQFLVKILCIDSKYNAVENSRNKTTVKRNN